GLQTLARDFRSIDPTSVRVVLCEGRDRVLLAYPPKLSEAAKEALARRHVDVRLDTKVVAVNKDGVMVETGRGEERIAAKTVVWAAGVKASPLGAQLGAQLERGGRVVVEPDLSIAGSPEVFAIGDIAKVISDGVEVPGVAQAAIQEGRHVAEMIAREVASDRSRRSPFHYRDKGNMATVGRAEAVIATKRFALHGLLAWLLWWVVHIYFLVGFRNRLLVMWSWAWSWITYKRGARLITGKVGALPQIAEVSGSDRPRS